MNNKTASPPTPSLQRSNIRFIALLFLTNPLLYSLTRSRGWFPPDSVAYAALARDFLAHHSLFLKSWGHIDEGLILPPLYPVLLALLKPFATHLLSLAEALSAWALILAGIPLYLLLSKQTSKGVAAGMVIALQFNAAYVLMGLAPLTEALFILVVALTLWTLQKALTQDLPALTFVAGLFCGLAFLARQSGLFVWAFAETWTLLEARLSRRGHFIAHGLRNVGLIAAGFLLLALPYAFVLNSQTGHYPWQQTFRMGSYEVTTEDASVRAEIEAIQAPAREGYDDIYARRRRMWRLLPDGRELYAYVREGPETARELDSPLGDLFQTLTHPQSFFQNLWNNLGYLRHALGGYWMVLFGIATITPWVIKRPEAPFLQRYFLQGFVLFNLVLLSLLSGVVPRHVEIYVPFAMLSIGSELTTVLGLAPAVVLLVLGALAMPHYTLRHLGPKPLGPTPACAVPMEDAPVFGLHPYDAYIVGGRYRILPNDHLDKIAVYAQKTGVEWLVVDVAAGREKPLYPYAEWYFEPFSRVSKQPRLTYQCTTGSGQYALFHIRPGR